MQHCIIFCKFFYSKNDLYPKVENVILYHCCNLGYVVTYHQGLQS